jgi:tetratricopeptide (TPR) repeat protein
MAASLSYSESGAAAERVRDCTVQLNVIEQLALQGLTKDPAVQSYQFAKAVMHRGAAYSEIGDQDHATADFDAAIAAITTAITQSQGNNTAGAVLYSARSVVHSAKGEYEQGLADADEVVHLLGASPGTYSLHAQIYAAMGDFDHAVAEFGRAMQSASGKFRGDVLYRRGAAYAAQGDYDRAIADEEEAIRSSRDADELSVRGVAYRGKGDLPKAIKDLSDSLSLGRDTRRVERLVERGHSYAAAGKYTEAIRDYGEALKISPRTAGALYGRGMAKRKSGDEAGGTADIAAAQAVDPNVSDAAAKSPLLHAVFNRP